MQRLIEIFGFGNRQHRAENLFLKNLRAWRDVGDDRGRDEVSFSVLSAAAGDQPALALADLDVVQDRTPCAVADHGAHIVRRIVRGAHLDARDPGLELFQELVVNLLVHDRARARRAFLPLIAERRDRHPLDSLVQIGVSVHDDRVLAAHFCDDALDPYLAGLMFGGQLVDPQSHVARAGEGNEARLGMLHHQVANGGPASGDQAERARGESCFEQRLREFGGDGRGLARGLQHSRISRD